MKVLDLSKPLILTNIIVHEVRKSIPLILDYISFRYTFLPSSHAYYATFIFGFLVVLFLMCLILGFGHTTASQNGVVHNEIFLAE